MKHRPNSNHLYTATSTFKRTSNRTLCMVCDMYTLFLIESPCTKVLCNCDLRGENMSRTPIRFKKNFNFCSPTNWNFGIRTRTWIDNYAFRLVHAWKITKLKILKFSPPISLLVFQESILSLQSSHKLRFKCPMKCITYDQDGEKSRKRVQQFVDVTVVSKWK